MELTKKHVEMILKAVWKSQWKHRRICTYKCGCKPHDINCEFTKLWEALFSMREYVNFLERSEQLNDL